MGRDVALRLREVREGRSLSQRSLAKENHLMETLWP